MQALPRDETAILTGQEDEASRNLRWLARSAHRRAELILRILLHGRGDQRGPDGAGTNTINSNAEADLLVRQAAGEGHNGAFGGGVVEQVRAADVGVHGGAVDDGVAGLHVLEGVLAGVEEGVDVGVEGAEPLVLAQLGDAVDHVLIAGVVDEDVDRAHARDRFVDQFPAVARLRDVRRVQVDFPPVLFHLLLRLLRVRLFLRQVVDQTLRAFHRVQDRDRPSDPRVPPRDDRFFAFELAGRFVDLVAAVFGGDVLAFGVRTFHVRLSARLLLVLDGYFVTCVVSQKAYRKEIACGPRIPCLNWSPSLVAAFAAFLTVSMLGSFI